jgi:hypothetical protein
MAAISLADCTVREAVPNAGIKELYIITPATADDGDTVAVTLGSYGISTLLDFNESIHTTENSVIAKSPTIADNATTVVSSGVLTITLATGTNVKHVFKIAGT